MNNPNELYPCVTRQLIQQSFMPNTNIAGCGPRRTKITIDCPSFNLLPHHERLIPHWETFAKGLVHREFDCLSLRSVELPKEVLDLLLPALETKKVRRLELHQAGLSTDGIVFLTELLKKNEHIVAISLVCNPLNQVTAEEVISNFSRVLYEHPSIEELKLSRCELGKNVPLCTSILHGIRDKPMELYLYSNHMSSTSANAISDFLSSNPKTHLLHLHGNAFEDEDAKVISQSLQNNTNLKHLKLAEDNYFSPVGINAMVAAVYDDSSMENIWNSNHTCEIDANCGWSEEALDRELYNWGRPVKNRRNKIFLKLRWKSLKRGRVDERYDVGFLKLTELPAGVLPKVLEWVQLDRNEGKEEKLTKVFEVLRFLPPDLIFPGRVLSGIGSKNAADVNTSKCVS